MPRPLAFRFPHPLALLVGCILAAAIATWVLPAGQYERRQDVAAGRQVVVPGTYHTVAPHPVGPFQALVAVPKGMADAGSVIFFVFLIGGALTVVDRTGALRSAVEWLVRRLRRRELLVVPIACLAFALGGILENMQEEILALMPLLLLLMRSLGMDALTACAVSVGAAAVGSAFSPVNPFQVGIAQKVAQLPLLSGALFRTATLVPALAIWIWSTMGHAARERRGARVEGRDELHDAGEARGGPLAPPSTLDPRPSRRHAFVLLVVLATYAAFVYGVLRLGWDFDQMAAVFFLMGVVVGLLGGLGVGGTAEAFVEGFRGMAYAALLIGFARAIYVVLEQGAVVDTIVHALVTPIAHLPLVLAALGMLVVQTAVHVPVPSVSGQAVLTMPLLVPMSDLLGLSRQVTVLVYQLGAGLCELLTPTNGALMAILAAAGVRYEDWLRFVIPRYLALVALGIVAVVVGIVVGW